MVYKSILTLNISHTISFRFDIDLCAQAKLIYYDKLFYSASEYTKS